jgi:GT2 family glycosyltransferase
MTAGTNAEKKLTILLPNYKTLNLTKLCLHSIRKYTDINRVKVIVIDNDSNDDSLDYLRSVKWITLIERKDIAGEEPAAMHARALDEGLARVDTEYVLSMHTDTIVSSPDWLDYLLNIIEPDDRIAGVGSWKLEQQSAFKQYAKRLESFFQTRIWFPLVGKKSKITGTADNFYYLRSHCALYRTALIQQYSNGFHDEGDTAGRVLHRKLAAQGFKMVFLPAEQLIKYMRHLNHATMILNPEISGKKTGSAKARRRIKRELDSLQYEKMLNDAALDQ